jgi:hypothetical protein
VDSGKVKFETDNTLDAGGNVVERDPQQRQTGPFSPALSQHWRPKYNLRTFHDIRLCAKIAEIGGGPLNFWR